jgi:hypothetical protein
VPAGEEEGSEDPPEPPGPGTLPCYTAFYRIFSAHFTKKGPVRPR